MSKEMDKVAIVRSMRSHEVVHFRGQYYTQAGRPLNPAQASEIPSVGSVVAHEFEGSRRESDTLPDLYRLQSRHLRLWSAIDRFPAAPSFGARCQFEGRDGWNRSGWRGAQGARRAVSAAERIGQRDGIVAYRARAPLRFVPRFPEHGLSDSRRPTVAEGVSDGAGGTDAIWG
jgi:hypothetical protein